MSQEQTSIDCPQCARRTLHARQNCPHLVHALVSLFLCGLWLPVWGIAAWRASGADWVCQSCGVRLSPGRTGAGTHVLGVLFVLACGGAAVLVLFGFYAIARASLK